MKQNLIFLFATISLFIITISAFSQTVDSCDDVKKRVCVLTTQNFYEEGDTIVISGKVNAVIQDAEVSVQVFFNKSLIVIDQVTVAQDGSYTTTIRAEGPLWKNDGVYIIKAAYPGGTAETNFEYQTKKEIIETTELFEVDAGSSGTFDVQYVIKGGLVKDIQIDPNILGLIVMIESENDGVITLNLPRSSIDAKKSNGGDETFIILINGKESPYEEKGSTENSRSISINFEEDDSEIEIIGTFVIPEFGGIAIFVLFLSIIAIILVSTQAKNLFKSFCNI